MEKVIVVMPALNAAATLEKTVADIPAGCVDEIILSDDGSTDGTVGLARKLGLTVLENPVTRGYGGNQKVCYAAALAKGADYVIMIHPDYQYDSRLIPVALMVLRLGICDVVLGNRVRTRKECLASGMPRYKYIANRFLTVLENVALGQNLGEFHTGFRAYRRKVLETVPFGKNSDDFVFDTQFLAQAVYFNFVLGDVPVPVRYFKEASSIGFRRSLAYGVQSLAVLAQFHLHRLRLIRSPLFSAPRP